MFLLRRTMQLAACVSLAAISTLAQSVTATNLFLLPNSSATSPIVSAFRTDPFSILSSFTAQPGASFAAGTWWQPFNAVTYMTDHLLGKSIDNRLKSSWYGHNRKVKTEALELALEMAGA